MSEERLHQATSLVFRARRLLYHSTQGSRVVKKKQKKLQASIAFRNIESAVCGKASNAQDKGGYATLA